jgi:hypothetical protein
MKKKLLWLSLAVGALWGQNPGSVMTLISIIDDAVLPSGGALGGDCSNYSVAYFNVVAGHTVGCVNTNPLNVTNIGKWTVTGGGGGGSSYLAGAGLTLTGTTFSVKYGTATATATEGNDSRIATALTASSPLNATNLTTGTVPAGRLPAPTVSALGGVQSVACAAASHLNAITTAGLPTCSADTGTGGATSVPIGGSAANRPATTPGTSSLFLQTDRNVGDQFSYYNGTAWYYPGAVDATMTRDGSTGAMGVNTNAIPRLGSPNAFTASQTITSTSTVPLQLTSSGTRTTFFSTNTNSTALGTHDWDMGVNTDSSFLIYDDTTNSTVFRRLGDGTATQLSGGVQINGNGVAKPTCAVAYRGTIWFVNGGAAADSMQACLYNGTAYGWRTITIP